VRGAYEASRAAAADTGAVQGQQQYEEQQRERRVAALGFQINPNPARA